MPTFSGLQFMQSVKAVDGIAFRDFEQTIDGQIKDKGELTLRQAIRHALNHNPDKADDEKKLDYFGIITKIYSTGPESSVELSSDEIVMIKNKCKQRWGAEALGFISNVLEGKNNDHKLIAQ